MPIVLRTKADLSALARHESDDRHRNVLALFAKKWQIGRGKSRAGKLGRYRIIKRRLLVSAAGLSTDYRRFFCEPNEAIRSSNSSSLTCVNALPSTVSTSNVAGNDIEIGYGLSSARAQ
jgi:hypothetical protein